MSALKDKILELRERGYSYNKIRDELGCTKSLIAYYVGDGQKEKNANRRRKRRLNPIIKKIDTFRCRKAHTYEMVDSPQSIDIIIYQKVYSFNGRVGMYGSDFTIQDVMEKIGEVPKCYLTNDKIDLSKSRTYHFDHIIPVSKGGDNGINNLGICTRDANQSKNDMTVEEYLDLCVKVLSNFGYQVIAPDDVSVDAITI